MSTMNRCPLCLLQFPVVRDPSLWPKCKRCFCFVHLDCLNNQGPWSSSATSDYLCPACLTETRRLLLNQGPGNDYEQSTEEQTTFDVHNGLTTEDTTNVTNGLNGGDYEGDPLSGRPKGPAEGHESGMGAQEEKTNEEKIVELSRDGVLKYERNHDLCHTAQVPTSAVDQFPGYKLCGPTDFMTGDYIASGTTGKPGCWRFGVYGGSHDVENSGNSIEVSREQPAAKYRCLTCEEAVNNIHDSKICRKQIEVLVRGACLARETADAAQAVADEKAMQAVKAATKAKSALNCAAVSAEDLNDVRGKLRKSPSS